MTNRRGWLYAAAVDQLGPVEWFDGVAREDAILVWTVDYWYPQCPLPAKRSKRVYGR